MGSFSIWHWLIVLAFIPIPLFFILSPAPKGENRFGPQSSPHSFPQAISAFFSNYVNMSGRASRSEFWYAQLFVILVHLVLTILDPTEALSLIWGLATLLPTITVTARRLHGINRSGWHQLLGFFIPVGTIGLIVWYCTAPKDSNTVINKQQPQSPNLNSLDVLSKLAALRDSGAITAEGYEIEKRKILNH